MLLLWLHNKKFRKVMCRLLRILLAAGSLKEASMVEWEATTPRR